MDSVEKELQAKIEETASVKATESEVLPKGTVLEDSLKKEQEPQPEKRKRGRPKGSKDKIKEPVQEPIQKQPDAITPMINGLVIPQVAKYYNKDVSDCMLSNEQCEMLAQMQPEHTIKPSWFWYSVSVIAILVGNVMQAKEVKKQEEEKKEELVIETRQGIETINVENRS